MGHELAATRIQLCEYANCSQSSSALGSETSGRPGLEIRVKPRAKENDSMINQAYLSVAPEATEWKLPSARKTAIICLVLTEVTLFSIFVAAYLFYIGKSLTGPTPREVLDLPVLATIFLLSSSVTIMLAERAFNRDRVGIFKLFWFATIVLAGLFLTLIPI